jgi:hypothetical protein
MFPMMNAMFSIEGGFVIGLMIVTHLLVIVALIKYLFFSK